MDNWRDKILNEFTPQVSRLTLVADPDGLVLEEGVLIGIRDRGFELIPFEDHIAFRYAYESKFRSKWDLGKQTDLVVVLRSEQDDLNSLPYDLLQAGRQLFFSIGELFPNLSYPVVADLDKSYLDELFLAQSKHTPDLLGDSATKEFILRHVFEIAPELIKQPSDLLRVLLRRHYRSQEIPLSLDERFIQVLRQNEVFKDWPLEVIVSDKELFFEFLQERWPIFLSGLTGEPGIKERGESYGLKIPGPSNLPFDHDDIRIYVDNLFLDGLLRPVELTKSMDIDESWVKVGVNIDPAVNIKHRIDGLLSTIEASIPDDSARHGDWFHFALRWSELLYLMILTKSDNSESYQDKFQELRNKIDKSFIDWSLKRYAGLINLPPSPPVMLHHIPRYLSRFVCQDKKDRVALIVIDGLSLDQWIVIRESLNANRSEFLFRENAVFAWIPTLTSVSRQTVFAGKPPVFFPDSVKTTEKEPLLWTQYWSDNGLTQNEIIYVKETSTFDFNAEEMNDLLSNVRTKVAGIVINKVDKIMHGMELGTAGMHNQVKQWIDQNHLKDLFNILLEKEFKIFITSDHGNIEAIGCGQLKEGVIADIRGQRARVYSDLTLRNQAKEQLPESIPWEPLGLPEDYFTLLAPTRSAFIKEQKKTVAHGGISLEEVIVPLVQVERRED